jgi:hypothetical protein
VRAHSPKLMFMQRPSVHHPILQRPVATLPPFGLLDVTARNGCSPPLSRNSLVGPTPKGNPDPVIRSSVLKVVKPQSRTRVGLAQGSLKNGEVRVGRRETPPIWNGERSKDRTRRAWFPDIPRCGSPDTGKHPFFTVTFGQTAEETRNALQNRMVVGRTNDPEKCLGTCARSETASVHARFGGKVTLVTTSNGSTTQESAHTAPAVKSTRGNEHVRRRL